MSEIKFSIFFNPIVVNFATGRKVMHKGDVKFLSVLKLSSIEHKFFIVCAFT